ncbi:MAG TPA: excinuclease ABC subunit UvrC [Thermoplasmata archaeon]|nr:excinuclease ABC subunit UvrC [Thermoplasmata archaeon]
MSAPELPGFLPASRLAALLGTPLGGGPRGPGVYLFRDGRGEVLYVGKARSLRRRVLDHLHVRVEKDGSIVGQSSSVEFVPTVSEREALLLEANLIKQYQPTYNTLLKDDRSYPYLAVTVGEEWPRILFVRRPRRGRKNVLFGPYTSAAEARGVAQLLAETFQIRRCVTLPPRACLYYHLKTCSAPCIGAVGREDYDRSVRRAIEVLRGDSAAVRPTVEADMARAVRAQEFERAALLRDALRGLDALSERQHVVGPGSRAVDVLALVFPRDPSVLRVAVGLLRVEEGEVRRTEPHLLGIPASDPPEAGELLRQFLVQYYGHRTDRPSRLVIAGPRPAGADEAIDWLEREQGIPVKFRPTGRFRALSHLAERLARAHLDAHIPGAPPREVLVALQSLLKLPTLPRRIEGTDISIFQGSEAVGSLVVFEGGKPNKDEYRRFRIRGVEGTNDFAMIEEVVRRRYTRRLADAEILPDLLLVDGGAGQLASAERALNDLGLADRVPAIGLAKREEEVYFPDRAEPLKANPNSAPLLLLRAVRDEAHRFAVTYHRKRRSMRLRSEVERAVRASTRAG